MSLCRGVALAALEPYSLVSSYCWCFSQQLRGLAGSGGLQNLQERGSSRAPLERGFVLLQGSEWNASNLEELQGSG